MANEMTNRYPGTCATCAKEVPAGEGKAYKARGARRYSVRHNDCEASARAAMPARRNRRSYSPRGRCEDAPCCGHSECGFGPGSPGYGSMVGGSPYYGEW